MGLLQCNPCVVIWLIRFPVAVERVLLRTDGGSPVLVKLHIFMESSEWWWSHFRKGDCLHKIAFVIHVCSGDGVY